MAKKYKYNQTQLLGRISELQESTLIEDNKDILELLVKLMDEELTLDSKSILELDMDLLDRLEELATSAVNDKNINIDKNNPFCQILNTSDAKVMLHTLNPTISVVTDKDFF